MLYAAESLALPLPRLPEECELDGRIAQCLALAASIALEHAHGPRETDPCVIRDSDQVCSATAVRSPVDDRARASYADLQKATEDGGEAFGVLVARRWLDRIVFARLPKGTGDDFRMRDASQAPGDTDEYERLECSGILTGTETAETRLRAKLRRLARYDQGRQGYAVVTRFCGDPVEIRVGRTVR